MLCKVNKRCYLNTSVKLIIFFKFIKPLIFFYYLYICENMGLYNIMYYNLFYVGTIKCVCINNFCLILI